ncbi:hypothetical protein [Myroides odoratimimus]|uniref:hypothetical protein n=1 Tax=Myroides odoratimimus TaxID=76832 RepID=UPI0025752AE9|nr:hypothetical protein [Myroides odoratimimus]MDM1514730.1 hypothetical protein [Myroides odoratimimus]MDM1537813.1 hypothetical protein [Myroides odoratimimus]MDM1677366.1 hypothetical protein [Myroides odoratimimus]
MTIDQCNKVLLQIEDIRKLDLDKKIAEIYPDQNAIENIQLSKMTVLDFLNLLERLLYQIEAEVRSENKIVLPLTISTGEYGQFNIDQVLKELYSQIDNKQLNYAEN